MLKPLLSFSNKVLFLFLFILPVFIISTNTFVQIKIKEKVDLKQVNTKVSNPNGCFVNGCQYDFCDTSYIEMRFSPETVEPGETTFITLWSGEFPFPENPFYTLSKYFSYAPTVGQLTQVNNYTYKYVAPNNIQEDSLVVTFDYVIGRWSCWAKQLPVNIEERDNENFCPDCFPYGRGLSYYRATKELTIKWDSLYVALEPEEVYPGDTVQVVIKKRKPDGTLVDFPPEQTYEIAKLEGCMLGNILVGDDSGSYFYDVSQPIYFAAADTLVGDSTGTVLLQVGLVDNVKQKELPSDHPKVIESNDCFIGSFNSTVFNYYDIDILKPVIRFEYPKPDTILWINAEPTPQMPIVSCKATLDNYCKRGKVFFDWEYWVRYTLFRHEYDTNDTICKRTGMLKITLSNEYEIGDPDGGGCPAVSNWSVSFDNNPLLTTVEFKGKHKNQEGGCEAIIDHWYEGDNIFIGGDVYVKITARDFLGKVIAIGTSSGGKILGKNPSMDVFVNYITQLDFQAVVRKETSLRGGPPKHFNFVDTRKVYWNKEHTFIRFVLEGWKYNPKGYPDYGPPNGYGFAQIDNAPPPTEMDLWNWQKNLNTGQIKHNNNKAFVRNNIRKIGALMDEKVILMNAYQMYNSGRPYWIWVEGVNGKSGYWDKNPNRGTFPEYAKDAYNIYMSLLNRKGEK